MVYSIIAHRRNDAVNEFIRKHRSKILGTLSGWDRVRFRGTIRMLAAVKGVVALMADRTGSGRLTGFSEFSEGLTRQLKGSVEQIAAAAGRSIRYLAASALSKEDLVQELLEREGISEGVVCVFSCVEPCRSFEVRGERQSRTIDLFPAIRKCLHWYVYFIDSTWGLCHVRIQSWLPFTVHVCINGREWLCRQLTAAGIGHHRRDNCLVDVADFTAAQKLLDAQAWTNWSSPLNNLLRNACPALWDLRYQGERFNFYWSGQETEYATDVLFRSPQGLAELYPPLLRHAITTFSSQDVLRFLGRTRSPLTTRVHPCFKGDVVSDWKARPEGVRIKHRANGNSIKMYDKQGSVLRIETTINEPRDMKVFRASEKNPSGPKSLRVLRKGVADLPRRAEISRAANMRYLTALSAVDAQTPLGQVADSLSAPVIRDGRRARGLNPMTGDDARLAAILLRGEFTINGFRNRDVRTLLFPGSDSQRLRLSGKVTRHLNLFRSHGLIQKIKGTHRYQLTAHGRLTLPAFTAARFASTDELNKIAA